MIYLITGVPGAGKTLRAVELIEGWVKAGRPVYARIDGLNMPGVQEAPDDWRQTPDGSVVVYDEAQTLFGAEGPKSGRSARADIQAMETHRHTGHDLVLVTQHPGLLHSHVRRLVGRHEHVQRVFGSKRVVIAWRDRCFDVDSRAERSTAVTQSWVHPARLFEVYKSASVHVSHAKLPGRIKWLAGFAVACLLVLGIAVSRLLSGPSQSDLIEQAAGVDGSVERVATAPAASESVPDHEPVKPWKVRPVVAGCIATISRCQCYTAQGWPIEQDMLECQRFITEPLPIKLAAAPLEHRADTSRQPAPDKAQRSEAAAPVAALPASSYAGRDPVALTGHVDPVALSAGQPSSVTAAPASSMPARLGNVGGGTRPAAW